MGLTLLSKCMMSFAIEPQKTSEPRPGMDMMGGMTEKQKDQHMLIMYDLSNQMWVEKNSVKNAQLINQQRI